MTTSVQLDEASAQRGALGLATLVLGLGLMAVVLRVVAGPPRFPQDLPSLDAVVFVLRGSDPPLAAMTYLLTMAAWVLWLWMVGSIILRLVVVSAEVATRRPRWVRSLRTVSDRLTLPIVRRLVDGALVAAIVVNLMGRPVPSAAATIPASVAKVTCAPEDAAWSAHSSATNVDADEAETTYTVQPGDTLWMIAERFYGSGYEYPRLVEANAGRIMADGRRFTEAGVILPGWTLLIPPPNPTSSDSQYTYLVKSGDTLARIAEHALGDASRWTEIFELNRGKAVLPDGRIFTEPDLIWPGLELQLPIPIEEPAVEPETEVPGLVPPPLDEIIPPAPIRPTEWPKTTPTPTPIDPAVANEDENEGPAPLAPTATIVPTVSVVIDTQETDEPTTDGEVPPALIYGGAAAAAALAGGTALLLRRRVRRSLAEPPTWNARASPPSDDFARSEFTRVLTHRLRGGEAELVVLAAGHVLRFFDEREMRDVSVLMARQGPKSMTFTLSVHPVDQDLALELAEEIVVRLGGRGWASVTPDHDILLHVSGLAFTRLVAAARPPVLLPRLLPLAMLPSREMLYANWHELGHLLVAGLPGSGTDIVLTSLVTALTTRCRPDELRIWTISSRHILPPQLLSLPHQSCSVIDPNDGEQVSAALDRVRTEIVRRMHRTDSGGGNGWSPHPAEPEIVLLMGDLEVLADDATTIELLGTHGPAVGVRLVAGTTHADKLDDGVMALFGTRLVLQTLDDDESIRLLGDPQAADLGSGELLFRFDGRTAIRAHGFRITGEHLDALLHVMHEADQGIVTTSVLDPDLPEEEAPSWEQQIVSPIDDETLVRSHANDPADLTMDDEAAQKNRGKVDTGVENEDSKPSVVKALAGEVESEKEEIEALLQVRCFGEFVVTSGDRAISPSDDEGTSYKAWEILAFLAAHPGGVVSKEKLTTAIWPDIESERAANRMRVAMARLRALLIRQVPELNSTVVRSERDGTCRLDTKSIWSDVQEFLSLCRIGLKLPLSEARGALEQAHVLYRGDLLSGHGTRFYEWVDDRADSGISLREHYREEYYRATQRLAQSYRQLGEVTIAVSLYKSLLRAEPTLEDIVREIYCCYQQIGDLGSLIRQDRELRQALQEAYFDSSESEVDPGCCQPEPETVALFNEIRSELEAKAAHARNGS